jgi:hypothetical protein
MAERPGSFPGVWVPHILIDAALNYMVCIAHFFSCGFIVIVPIWLECLRRLPVHDSILPCTGMKSSALSQQTYTFTFCLTVDAPDHETLSGIG